MCDFQVGFAKKDITPPLGTLLMGYPRERISTRVMDKLYASAIAIKQDTRCVVLICADIALVPTEASDEIRADVSESLGIPFENVVIFAIHTHSGPVTTTIPGWGFKNDGFLRDLLIPNAVEAAKKAYAAMQPALMAVGTADCYASANRREFCDGKVILGLNPEGPYDPTVTLVRFQTPEGLPIASFVHHASHPTAAGSNFSITRDWPGFVVDHIEQVSGAGCLFINGAQGDIGPRLPNSSTGKRTEKCVMEIGTVVAEAAQKAYESATSFFVPQVRIHTGDICIPYNPVPAREDLQAQIDALPEHLVDVDIQKDAKLRRLMAMLDSGQDIPTHYRLRQSVIALGDLALVPGPFEAFCNVAKAIGTGSPYQKTLYLGLANGYLCYLPTMDQLPYGGYEVDSFHASGITGFVENTSELFTDGCIQLLKQLKES